MHGLELKLVDAHELASRCIYMVTPVVPFVTSTGVCECEELIVPQGVVVVVAQRTMHADKQPSTHHTQQSVGLPSAFRPRLDPKTPKKPNFPSHLHPIEILNVAHDSYIKY